jgi:hypothetical protein
VRCRLGQQRQRRRFEPGIHLVERPRQRRWRRIDARMRDERKEFVQARPRNGPGCRSFGKLPYAAGLAAGESRESRRLGCEPIRPTRLPPRPLFGVGRNDYSTGVARRSCETASIVQLTKRSSPCS